MDISLELITSVLIKKTKLGDKKMAKCQEKTEVYSRVCGYFRPTSNWNRGKKEEFKERKEYNSQSSNNNKVN